MVSTEAARQQTRKQQHNCNSLTFRRRENERRPNSVSVWSISPLERQTRIKAFAFQALLFVFALSFFFFGGGCENRGVTKENE